LKWRNKVSYRPVDHLVIAVNADALDTVAADVEWFESSEAGGWPIDETAAIVATRCEFFTFEVALTPAES